MSPGPERGKWRRGRTAQNPDPRVARRDGRPLNWQYVRARWLPEILARARLPRVTGYSLRHAFVASQVEHGLEVRHLTQVTGYVGPYAVRGVQS